MNIFESNSESTGTTEIFVKINADPCGTSFQLFLDLLDPDPCGSGSETLSVSLPN
jgi:hypothetical protein